jgi:hypothetical protein
VWQVEDSWWCCVWVLVKVVGVAVVVDCCCECWALTCRV